LEKNTNYTPPNDALEALARCLFPAIVEYFESDEGKREFAEWQAQQHTNAVKTQSKKSNDK